MHISGILQQRKTNIIFAGLFFLSALSGLFAVDSPAGGAVTRRFGIFIGSNNGGRDRVVLRYAVSDAKSVSRIFTGMGGIMEEDCILLVEPSVAEIKSRLDALGRLSAQARRNSQRTELVFYYSGHSDENGILLDRESYDYRELRDRIGSVQADMRIVILDSCSSGAITRAKGGVKTQPFLFDSSVSAEGYAYLTSSSADEASQESDSIGSSYFTHSLLAGLRGAADSVGDGRVTLNELYRFAYTETLAKTETSLYGVQHPSYDIQISGSGDVVLTDIKEISAGLVFSEGISGRISIRDSSDFLVAELTKMAGKPIELGLEPGLYRITLQQGDNYYRTEQSLTENRRAVLTLSNFSLIAAAESSRRRGDEFIESDAGDDVPVRVMSLQLLPGFDVLGHSREKATNNFIFGLFIAMGHNINGIGAASIGLINTGYVHGVQASGIFNMADGHIRGVQEAGIFNYAGGDVWGVQSSGVFNYAGGGFIGIQGSGVFNFAGGDSQGIQASGIFNYLEGSFRGLEASGIFNYAEGSVNGLQASGIFNLAGELHGMQTSLVNVNSGGSGVMIGLVNVSKSEEIVPFGLVNVMKNGLMHGAIYIDDMLFTNVSFRSGTKHFYSVFSVGTRGDRYMGSGDSLLAVRSGFGFEIPIRKFFINIDLMSGSIINLVTLKDDYKSFEKAVKESADGDNVYWDDWNSATYTLQLRLIGGYKFFEHLGIFSGFSYNYFYRYRNTNPDPRDLGGLFLGGSNNRHSHKFGFFGGVQF